MRPLVRTVIQHSVLLLKRKIKRALIKIIIEAVKEVTPIAQIHTNKAELGQYPLRITAGIKSNKDNPLSKKTPYPRYYS